jgi:hypothetical protein
MTTSEKTAVADLPSMKNRVFLPLPTVVLVLLWSCVSHAGERNAIQSSTQLIVVTTSGWNAVDGQLQRFQRSSPKKAWSAIGEPVGVVVGKNGLGWGSGVVLLNESGFRDATDPVKKEGDGKAPAGIFRLSTTFGYADSRKPKWKMPYLQLTQSVECVDDSASRFYNTVVDRTQVTADWTSSEHMLRADDLYRWGVVVDHNAGPPKAGDGSCIFLHIWRGPGQGTVGCTAMPQEQLESILGWLDPRRKPLLVQLPTAEYQRLRHEFSLP